MGNTDSIVEYVEQFLDDKGFVLKDDDGHYIQVVRYDDVMKMVLGMDIWGK
jgi:predicted transcriptional regulator